VCGSPDGPIDPLKLIRHAYNLLYVLLFISLFVVMGYWEVPSTIPFLGAILALLLPVLFSRKELFSILEDDVHMCTLTDTTEH